LLPEPLIDALAKRSAAPRLARDHHGWRLELAGEPASAFDPADHDPAARADTDRIVVSLSTALGIEALAPAEATPLLDAYHEGILGLGGPFELWGAAVTPSEVEAVLDAGARGITLPAQALLEAGAEGAPDRRVDDILARLSARNAPLFVHPGPASASRDAPSWWPAMTDYVAQMSAAWHWFAAIIRPRHPRLRVVFAMLAGGGPLHAERLAARGGPASAIHDPLVWFDTSSYGPIAIDAMLRVVGVDRLVHGSDRPVVTPRPPHFGPAVEHALTVANPDLVLA
jgi:hypothetical protein